MRQFFLAQQTYCIKTKTKKGIRNKILTKMLVIKIIKTRFFSNIPIPSQ